MWNDVVPEEDYDADANVEKWVFRVFRFARRRNRYGVVPAPLFAGAGVFDSRILADAAERVASLVTSVHCQPPQRILKSGARECKRRCRTGLFCGSNMNAHQLVGRDHGTVRKHHRVNTR